MFPPDWESVPNAEVKAPWSVKSPDIFLAVVLNVTNPIRVRVGPNAKLEARPEANSFSRAKSGADMEEDSSRTKKCEGFRGEVGGYQE